MNATDEKTQLLNEFSQRIQRHFPTDVWHSLFQDRTGSAQVGSTTRTVLCIECPESGAMSGGGVLAALQRLAPLHGGCVDPCAPRTAR